MEYRLLKETEHNRLGEIDRTETVEHIYYHKQGKLELVKEFYQILKWSQGQV